jgi:hypothetical protein
METLNKFGKRIQGEKEMLHVILGTVLGYAAGVCTPGIIRRLRSEAKLGVSLVDGEIAAAKKDIAAEVKKI